MRRTKGKLIAVWTPGNHGAGVSTITFAAAVAIQHMTNSRTLAINMGSTRNYMEQYISKDVEARFSMDYLKSFDRGITAEHILTYSSAINENLYLLPNCKIANEVSRVGTDFYIRLLEEALNAFDFVFIDIEAGLSLERQNYLNKADLILAILNENPILLEELFRSSSSLKAYVKSEKTLAVFNLLREPEKAISTLNLLNKRLSLSSSFGIADDVNLHRAASYEGKLYSFIKSGLTNKKADDTAISQIVELCRIAAEKLAVPIEAAEEKLSFFSMLFSKARLRGEVDV